MEVLVTGAAGHAGGVGPSGSRLVQTASFAPRGLGGPLHRFVLHPFHAAIGANLRRRVAEGAACLQAAGA
jgi:hypothetical protein